MSVKIKHLVFGQTGLVTQQIGQTCSTSQLDLLSLGCTCLVVVRLLESWRV